MSEKDNLLKADGKKDTKNTASSITEPHSSTDLDSVNTAASNDLTTLETSETETISEVSVLKKDMAKTTESAGETLSKVETVIEEIKWILIWVNIKIFSTVYISSVVTKPDVIT